MHKPTPARPRLKSVRSLASAILVALTASSAWAAGPTSVIYKEPLVAIENARLIDGTGSPAKNGMTILIRDGRIAAVTAAPAANVPAGARRIDGRGKTVLPGLVFMHEHMFYPTGDLQFGEMLESFPPLYLAGGVTTARTAGSLAPYADLNLRDAIASGSIIGPDLDVTGPYIEGKGLPVYKVHGLADADEAERFVNYWADTGATSFKAYILLSRAVLKRAIDTAHKRGAKITGHLCSITYREAAELGIDNLEHGFGVMTDLVKGKQPDVCPMDRMHSGLDNVDPDSHAIKSLIDELVSRKVALTSTLVTFEDAVPGRPRMPKEARVLLLPQILKQYDDNQAALGKGLDARKAAANFAKMMKLERLFVAAGGILMAGTDPTGVGGVIPGFASKRQLQLLVEAGFTMEQAVQIGSLNGARFLGREREIGSVEVGKRADLIVIDGDPTRDPKSIERMLIIFKKGIGYDPKVLFEQAKGLVGLR